MDKKQKLYKNVPKASQTERQPHPLVETKTVKRISMWPGPRTTWHGHITAAFLGKVPIRNNGFKKSTYTK